ncbi:MAG: PH domain-containing protein [Burkholderiaceae bacterium]
MEGLERVAIMVQFKNQAAVSYVLMCTLAQRLTKKPPNQPNGGMVVHKGNAQCHSDKHQKPHGKVMASYIEKNLIAGEKIIYKGSTSLWSFFVWIILGIITIPGGIGLVILLAVYLKYISTELAFTDKRVIAKFGFIRRKTIEMRIEKVESIQVDQGLMGRLLNYGTLIVSGAGNPQAPIPNISKPMEFRKSFMEFQDSRANAS